MVNVTSEIGRLRQVLLHEPGPEVDRMVPAMMEELLFDDILFGDGAREEHGRFRRVLQVLGVRVVEALDLLAQALEVHACREWIESVALVAAPVALKEQLQALPPAELARALVAGVRGPSLGATVELGELYAVAPLPNWCFQRDPQIVLGRGVVFSAMATAARHREALLARAMFRFHNQLRHTPVLHDALEAEMTPLEGGDLLVLSPHVLAVGQSARTSQTSVRQLVRALHRREEGPRWFVVVEIPRRRAYMHLDTLITPVDREACLCYAPVILAGSAEQARVYEVDLHGTELRFEPKPDLLSALAARGIDLRPIACGGADPVVQQREQWTDGANALAVAPGVITLYDRNVGTIRELDRHGFRIVEAEHLLLGREEVDLAGPDRACIVIPSHELSRARGGPHCLVHPLVRDDLDA
jgi:arginine deiminase